MQTVEANECTIKYTIEEAKVLGLIFAQTYSLIKGIKQFGDKGLVATLEEVNQLNGRTYFRPIDGNKLTSQEHRRSGDHSY